MTTTEALEAITDEGKFEVLALRVLRHLEPDCTSVIHVGVNTEGKTVVSPVDGFCLVPASSPRKFVSVAFTTCRKKDLRQKWLFDIEAGRSEAIVKGRTYARGRQDGDLIKAGKLAVELRKTKQDAEFIVYLCTNRVPSTELTNDAIAKGGALGLEVRILECSRMRDFLDCSPEGQWLREEHLEIEADQLSRALLQQLSGKTVQLYAAEMLFTTPPLIVDTQAARDARVAIRDESVSIHLLVGSSGVGKTVVAFEALRQHIASGGIGLWISREVLERAKTVGDAVADVLRTVHPRLNREAGNVAVQLGSPTDPLLLVVDDVNRSPEASKLIQKIIGWGRLECKDASGSIRVSSVRLVCPVWDSNFRLNVQLLEPNDWLRVRVVGPMERSESVHCLRVALGDPAGKLTEFELGRLAEIVKDDAILLGLLAESVRKQPEADPLELAQNVIGNWVDQAIGQVAAKSGSSAAEYAHALSELSGEMIRRKNLGPTWDELEEWFAARQRVVSLIGQLAADGTICRVSKSGGQDEFQFRHDRILEFHIRRSMCAILAEHPSEDSAWDPFFVPCIAWALCHEKRRIDLLGIAAQRNPVTLVAAIEYLPDEKTEFINAILSKARDFLEELGGALPSVQNDTWWLLANIQSPHVLTLTEGLAGDRRILFGRLRNGDAYAGARALTSEAYPTMNYPWLEGLIHEAKSKHGKVLVSKLRDILTEQELSGDVRSGALALAGYIGEDSLAQEVREAWVNSGDRLKFLEETLWATLRCANETPEEFLPPLFAAILELEDVKGGGQLSNRQETMQALQFLGRHGFSATVIKLLTKLGEREEYQGPVMATLDRVDDPIAVDFVVRTLAFWNRHAREGGGFSPWALSWSDKWTRAGSEGPSSLSTPSKRALLALWQGEGNPDWLREYALGVWAKVGGELRHLQEIGEASPLFSTGVWYRALKGDRAVVSHVISMVDEKPWWLHLLAKIWCKEAAERVDLQLTLAEGDHVALSNRNYQLAEILRDIPINEAEELLYKHWGGLCRSPLYVQVALYLSTEESRRRAAESICQIGPDLNLLADVSHLFGFMTLGLSDRLAIRHMESLRPFLGMLSGYCIFEMLRFCARHGHWDWATKVLKPECIRRSKAAEGHEKSKFDWDPDLRELYFPTDAELLGRLDNAEMAEPKQRAADLWRWAFGFSERGDNLSHLFKLAERWLKTAPSVVRLKMVAYLIREHGTRKHLAILETHKAPGNELDCRSVLNDVTYAVCRQSLT